MADVEDFELVLWAARRSGARLLLIEGNRWFVYELPAALDRRYKPSLVFESDTVIRRVRSFPQNWRELADDALATLSWAP
jgi:hypothetical protein